MTSFLQRRLGQRPTAQRMAGLSAAFTSALFLGLAPVFGKQAILLGMPPIAVAAVRTLIAALLFLVILGIFRPGYLYIYPAGLLGCLLAGGVNGLGSLLYYSSLARIDASIGQMLNSTYPIFVALWLLLERQKPSKLTIFRLGLTIPAVYLLTQAEGARADLVGMLMMLGAAALYALHLPINQRVLYEMPAPTVTMYTLLAMSAVVVPWYLFFGYPYTEALNAAPVAWLPVVALALATFIARLTLFIGVKSLGGMQTALIGLSELLVTVLISFIWLGERFTLLQWCGAALLLTSVLLVGFEKKQPAPPRTGGLLHWLSPPTPNIDLLGLGLPPPQKKE